MTANNHAQSQPQTISERAKQTAERAKAAKEAKAAAKEKAALLKAIGVVQALREVSPNMTLNQALVFLEVAARAGKHGKVENLEVRQSTGLEKGMLGKIVQSLSPEKYSRSTGKEIEGMALVDLSGSDTDGRAKQLHLTDKGRNLSDRVIFSIS